MTVALLVAALPVAVLLLWCRLPFWAFWLPLGLVLAAWMRELALESSPWIALPIVVWLVAGLLFGVRFVRASVFGPVLMKVLAPIFPRMSDTERIALEAGTTWWDAELFSGRPDWEEILAFQPKELSPEERAFMDGPLKTLCAMLDDARIRKDGDLPREAWDYIRRERFMGMIVPASHGGLGFSARANSTVVATLATRSIAACVTVMVPNSLGPAELLVHYGTDEQKRHWLPRLARGEEIPCFALTEPHAGSDAGGMRAEGVVCREMHEGREVLGMRLDWSKRYITLAPVATVVGLAFRLRDPDGLLGGPEDLGITCALIPASTKGVVHGRRHDPLGVPFMNGPVEGHGVFVPLDAIIGGPRMAGQGWRMLMECLSAGRSISLPADSVGGAQLALRVVGAYASVREQFDLAIGRFEGVESAIGRIAGTTYWMNCVRETTAGAVDAGEKPAVVSAIAKAWTTEAMRRVVGDAMDVVGGAGICRGPRNLLSSAWQAVPIGITVEGANILTRTMIVFGQGAIRCHPHALAQMRAAADGRVADLEEAFFAHVGHVACTATRASLLSLTGSALAGAPASGQVGSVLRRLERLSASFAFVSELAMGTLGGGLKRKENLTGRLADALAWSYIAAACCNRHHAAGQPARDAALFGWATEEALHQVEKALRDALDELPNRPAAWLGVLVCFPFGARRRGPGDALQAAAARSVLDGGVAREVHTALVHVPVGEEPGLATLESALAARLAAGNARSKLKDAVRAKKLAKARDEALVSQGLAAGIIDQRDAALVLEAARLADLAIAVDDHDPDEYKKARG
jgi:acyl-CoA dehydrogenase